MSGTECAHSHVCLLFRLKKLSCVLARVFLFALHFEIKRNTMVEKITSPQIEFTLKRLVAETMSSLYGSYFNCTEKPIKSTIPEPIVQPGKFSDFQCSNAMGLSKILTKEVGLKDKLSAAVAEEMIKFFKPNDLIDTESLQVSPQGFIMMNISTEWLKGKVQSNLLEGVKPPEVKKEKVLVDFSSPNIAKEMHVGHLRSTIIGEALCRMFEWVGHDVQRINHVGDWGTQFGMLILHMKQRFPDFLSNPPPISDLVVFYKEAKKRFDEEPEFKEQARLEVVELQSGKNAVSTAAWKQICELSRVEFQEIYSRLDVQLEEKGESFYNPMIPDVIDELKAKGAVEVSDGAEIIISRDAKAEKDIGKQDVAKVIRELIKSGKDGSITVDAKFKDVMLAAKILKESEDGEPILSLAKDGKEDKKLSSFDPVKDYEKLAKQMDGLFRPKLDDTLKKALQSLNLMVEDKVRVPTFVTPFMARKSDGAFTYDSTDLAAIYYRFRVEKCNRVVYVTDVGQETHFNMIARVAADVNWMNAEEGQRWAHAGFGLVSGEDGKKLKTRSGETVKLKDLLDEACRRAEVTIREREQEEGKGHDFTDEEITALSKKLGYGAVKYFDLMRNRTSDYGFSYDKMLDPRGNTAIYLLYSYARIASIKRKVPEFKLDASFIETHPIEFEKQIERKLAFKCLSFADVLTKTLEDLCPHHITDFCYELTNLYCDFYRDCRVVGHELQASRLQLIELVGQTLKQALALLGIEVTERI